MGPVTSNTIYGFRSDILLKLLTLKAGKDYPLADPTQISTLVPYYVQQLNSQMTVGVTTVRDDKNLYESISLKCDNFFISDVSIVSNATT